MSSAAWQRRRFLKALGVGAAALPFYRLIESTAVEGQDAPSPMRLLLLYSNGSGNWEYLRPRGLSGPDAALTPDSLTFDRSVLEPLRAYTSRMTVIEGLSIPYALLSNDGGRTYFAAHEWTAPTCFTGAAVGDEDSNYRPAGPSLEFELASRFGDTDVRSLQMGFGGSCGLSQVDGVSYDADGRRLPGMSDPGDAYAALFGSGTSTPSDPEEEARGRRRQLAVLSAVRASAERVEARLGAVERTKLESHLDALADIERRLSGPVRRPISCDEPVPPTSDPEFAERNIPLRTELQFETLAQAFACDRTRFVSGTIGPFGVGGMTFLDMNVSDLHNDVAHQIDGDTPEAALARERMATLNRFYAEQLATFLDRLDAIPEADGSVLDNTLIVWGADFGNDVHSGLNVPFILLGGAQRRLRMGRYIDCRRGGDPHDWQRFTPNNQLLVSILNAFGVETDRFNSSEFTGELSGLAT